MQHTSFAPLKLSAAVMLACLSFAAQAQTANKVEKTDKEVPVSPFAFLNLNLQASESSSGNFNIPPRLMILFDDSGSMGEGVQGLPNSSPYVRYNRQGGHYRRVLHVTPRGSFGPIKANRSCVTNKDYPNVRADAYDFGGKYGVNTANGDVLFPSLCFACKDGSKPNIKLSTWEYELVDSSGRIKQGNSISCGRNTYRQYTQLFDPNSKAIPVPMLTDVIVSTYSQGVSPEENTRMGVARRALTNIVDRYKDEFSWSLMSLWGTEKRLTQLLPVNAVPYFAHHAGGDTRVHEFTKAGTKNDYAAFKDRIKRLRPGGYTPTTTRYLQAVDYLISTKEYICQNDYVIIFSDGDANVEHIRDYQFQAYQHRDFYGNLPYNYQISGPGQQNGIAFFSRILDGRSSGNYGQSGDTKSSRFSYYSPYSYMNKLFAGNDKDNTQWDGFEHNGEMYFDKQPIKTFSIAFGGGTSAQGNAYLRDASSNNKVYNAANESQLNTAFEDILREINKDNEEHKPNFETGFSASSAAFAGAGDQKLDRLAAQLTLNPHTWSSEFKFLKLDKQGKQTTESVPADYSTNRKVIISYVDGNGQQWTEDMNTNSRHLYPLFGFNASQRDEFHYAFLPWYLRSGSTDADIERSAQYLRGRGMQTKVKQYRQRTANAYDPARMMADVMGAPVVALDYSKGRPRYMLTAANDGMMYLFEKTDNNNRPYTLRLNYLPASMQRESTDFSDTVAKASVALAETDYGSTLTSENISQDSKPHLFLNSGGIQWRQTSADKNGNSATYIAGAMGQGGRGAYVLAISGKDRAAATPVGLDNHESNWAKTVPMWETPKGQNNKLGYTVSTPQFAQVATKLTGDVKDKTQGVRQLLFLANGYDAPADVLTAPMLYIYDALGQDMAKQAPTVKTGTAGSLVKTISVQGGLKGLSTPTLVDIDADNLADVAYAGDQGGNLYRFDLRGDVDSWTAHKIYNGKASQPITAAPAVYKESSDSYMVIVGTGSDIYQKDLEDKSQQVVLGIRDKLTEKTPTPIEQSQLVEQKILGTTGTSGTGGDKKTLRYLTRKIVADGSPGWMLTLGSDGERVVTQASVINRTAVFTSRVYTTKKSSSAPNTSSQSNNAYSCKINKTSTKSESTGWLFAVDVKTGSNPLEGSAYFKDLGEQSKTSFNAGEKEAIDGDEALKVAALQIDGLSSGATLNSFEALARTVKAVNANGAFGSGQDLAIDAAQGRNDCVEHGDYTVGVVSSTTGYESTGLEAFKCPTEGGRLIRINSRPIIE